MRPRIRTIKPEIWSDEKVGDLSHGARLLFVGLITMADDEGRLRELPAAMLGHVFPYDNVSAAKLSRWLGEVERSRMITRYVVDEKRYIAFPHWTDHQRVDKPNDSELPPPPDSPNGSGNNHRSDRGTDRGSISDQIADQSRSLRAGADPIRSDPILSRLCQRLAARIRENDPKADPRPESERWLTDMRLLVTDRGGDVAEVERIIDWCQSDAFWRSNILSPGKLRKQFTQLVLKAEPSGKVVPMRSAALERMDAWRNAPEYQRGGDAG